MISEKDLEAKWQKLVWCPGCGNYGILSAIKKAIIQSKVNAKDFLIVSGIGCHGNMAHLIKVYGFHAIHGRALPVATGALLANNKLKVLVCEGDGDALGIGGNHLIHAMRRNLDLTLLVHDNQIYGLTVGQYSPTSDKEMKTISSPFGAIDYPINPISLGIASGASFVARGFTGKQEQLTQLILQGLKHKGFSLIDILQPCVTFNKKNTFEWYAKRVYNLQERKHNIENKLKALERAFEWHNGNQDKKIPIGVFYKVKKKTYSDFLPAIQKKPLVKHSLKNISLKNALNEFV